MARFARAWFDRPAPEVAAALLGSELVRVFPDGQRRRVRIVETEAYEADDPPSHSHRGQTARNGAMFGPPGRLYVYRIYGIHRCCNVVTGPAGHGAAVLLRAGEPLEGAAGMARARGTNVPRLWCDGPGKLAQALEIDALYDGTDLLGSGPVRLVSGESMPRDQIECGPRVGVSTGVSTPWRFVVRDSPWVSRPRLSRPSSASRP